MSIILHITHRKEWEACTGKYYSPPSLDTEGFIHCSTIDQTEETANLFFANQRNLVLLFINTKELESPLKYESPSIPDDKRNSATFPHIYGPLNISAVIRVIDFLPNADGKFVIPVEIRQFEDAL
jgi:uncharacterized protein (DUF952 family)